jgi:Rod binding domain-containing protein
MELGGISTQLGAAVEQARTGPEDAQRAARLGALDEAAHKFEELLATMIVKELRRGLPAGPFGDGPGADTFAAWFDEQLGSALAESGALDIAGRIKASLGAQYGEHDERPA